MEVDQRASTPLFPFLLSTNGIQDPDGDSPVWSSNSRELYITNTGLKLWLETMDTEDLGMVSALFGEGTITTEVKGGILGEKLLNLWVESGAGGCCWDCEGGSHDRI